MNEQLIKQIGGVEAIRLMQAIGERLCHNEGLSVDSVREVILADPNFPNQLRLVSSSPYAGISNLDLDRVSRIAVRSCTHKEDSRRDWFVIMGWPAPLGAME